MFNGMGISRRYANYPAARAIIDYFRTIVFLPMLQNNRITFYTRRNAFCGSNIIFSLFNPIMLLGLHIHLATSTQMRSIITLFGVSLFPRCLNKIINLS
ncbi:hypothetical protein Hanom_Chr15g01404331 [Helianthus anomalus]